MSLDIEQFNPTIAELHRIVGEAQAIDVSDFEDLAQLKLAKKHRLTLRDARVAITKKGKEMRDDALKFQKAVISREKELVAIVEPDEERLQALEDKAMELQEIKRRRLILPERAARLRQLGDGIETGEDDLLDMSDEAFSTHYNTRLAAKNEADRLALEQRERAVREAEEKQKHEAEMREREERAREDERQRIEREEQERKARDEREKRDAAEREQRAKEEAEAREKADQARLRKEKRYKEFRANHGVTDANKADFKEERVGNAIILWKKIDVFVVTD